MDAMTLFVSGIVAGIAVVYAIILYFKYMVDDDTAYSEREINNIPEREMEETYPVSVVSFEDIMARYDAAIEIFAVRET